MIKNHEIAADLSDRMLTVCCAINDAIILVQDNCPADEFTEFRRMMGRLLDQVYVLGLEPLYEAHPDLAPPELEFVARKKPTLAKQRRTRKKLPPASSGGG